MTRILAIFLVLLLSACGGVGADPAYPSGPVGANPAPAQRNTDGLAIQRPATALDGYNGGLAVTRDTTGLGGGARGYVNTTAITHTVVGQDMVQFEWASLALLENRSNFGENVATYSQGNKFGLGPTWAAVSEATDTTGLGGGLVAHEFDLFVTGPDNGSRIGLDIVSGDARAVRNLGRSAQADATVAIRIGQTATTPWANWGTGLLLQGTYRDSVIKILAPNGAPLFEIRPNGDIYRRGVLLP